MAIYQLITLHRESTWHFYHFEGAVFQVEERDHHVFTFGPFTGWDTFDQVQFLNSPKDNHPTASPNNPEGRYTILACRVRRLFK